MALIQCPHCGKKISGIASSCPFCDFPLKESSRSEAENPYYSEDQTGYGSRRASSRMKSSSSFSSYNSFDLSGNNANIHEEDTPRSARRTYADPAEHSSETVFSNPSSHSTPSSGRYNRSQKETDLSAGTTDIKASKDMSAPEKNTSDSGNAKAVPTQTPSRSFRPRPGSAGHKLLGYRDNSFLHMFLMLFYDLGAAVLILYGFKSLPQYTERGLASWHIARTIVGALLLYMPTILLSMTRFRRSLPLLKRGNARAAALSLILSYIPVLILFIIICLKFR